MRFVQSLMATAQAGILLLLALLWPARAAGETADALARFEFSEPQMGVPFRIVFYARDAQVAKIAAEAAFKRVADLNAIMSDYETDSELNELSRTSGRGKAVHVSDDLWAVLERAQGFAAESDGAFDVTVGPVVSHWRKARRTHQMPAADSLSEALKAVGYTKMRLSAADHTVELTAPRMKLDLGGIAKGYALDEELKVLAQHGITRVLATGAGDMAIGDPPPGKTGWRIEIAPLDITNAPPKVFVSLARVGLATSGDVFQRLEIEGKRYSHIVDPHTGIGLTDHSLVTVIAPDCTTAEGLSKIVSVLGPARGLEFVENTPKAAAHIVRAPDGQIQMRESRRFRNFVED
ncbi:MAG: FAD:protein FMN transferase [Verrucomicrobiota bacterium]